ncbi:MAG: helix-turn-helix transcriptional regulator [Anaerovoracaceae bacterium]
MEETHLKELDNAAIGARIRARRESLDMTRADLAGRIPLNEKSVAEIEYGNRGLSLKTLFRLKQILGVSTDYILEGDPEGLTEEEQKSILRDNIMDSLSICSEGQLVCMEGIARLCTESIVQNEAFLQLSKASTLRYNVFTRYSRKNRKGRNLPCLRQSKARG